MTQRIVVIAASFMAALTLSACGPSAHERAETQARKTYFEISDWLDEADRTRFASSITLVELAVEKGIVDGDDETLNDLEHRMRYRDQPRSIVAVSFDLKPEASWNDIDAASVARTAELSRKYEAMRLKLPEKATQSEIDKKNASLMTPEQREKEIAWQESRAAERKALDAKLRVEALDLGLPADASYRDVRELRYVLLRQKVAVKLKLWANASWWDIYRKAHP